MIRKMLLLGAAVAALGASSGCNDKPAGATSTTAPAATPGDTSKAAPTAAPASTPASTASAASGTKSFDCGARDKPCPMQGWMKRVMAPASMGDDGAALAKALTYVADHAPPGMADWTTMAKAGAAKAKAGDLDGARASCKQCHDAYKDRYKTTLRDLPF